MFVKRNFSLKGILSFTGGHLIWLTLWATSVTVVFELTHAEWMAIPWLPVSLIGTALAFYLGFKNNSSYDRMWEARKIWGGIVNASRSWGTMVKHFVTNQFANEKLDQNQLKNIHQALIYRHIFWLYTLRKQLLKPAPWEHSQGSWLIRKATESRVKTFGIGLLEEDDFKLDTKDLLDREEFEKLCSFKNPATHLIDNQSKSLEELRESGHIEDFRHMELQKLLTEFYTLQGKCERIKNYPFPRQYASASFMFISVFIFLLPFGLLSQFHELNGQHLVWLTIPFTVIVGWVFLFMELVGDYSENPFEGLGNDIPMKALCRTIEIDLREMLGETNLPQKVEPVSNVLL